MKLSMFVAVATLAVVLTALRGTKCPAANSSAALTNPTYDVYKNVSRPRPTHQSDYNGAMAPLSVVTRYSHQSEEHD